MFGASHKFDYSTPSGQDAQAKKAVLDAATPGTPEYEAAMSDWQSAMVKLGREQYTEA
jgi:hypothetical protein